MKVMASANGQLDRIWSHLEDKPPDTPARHSLWVCLCGIILIMLIDVGRTTVKEGGTIPWAWIQFLLP